MKTLLFTGRVVSEDKEPLSCREEVEIAVKEVLFKNYPLSLLKTTLDNDGITVDGIRYEWQMLPSYNKQNRKARHRVSGYC